MPTPTISKQTFDRSHNIWGQGPAPLDAIFRPKSIAVIGATEKPGSVGRTLLSNLIQSPFGGIVFPVNAKREAVLGIKAFPNIASVPAQVDLAVIVTPAQAVPDIIRECVEAKVRSAVIISAGFKELGAPGLELERRILAEAAKSRLRIIGPNCLGVMNPAIGLNATFAGRIARRGHVGFISQSGALCTAVLDWSLKKHVGFSSFISVGSMIDVNWGDLIDYLGNDPNTHSILMYMESIGDARSFLSAAREVALTKPIIVLKAGRTALAAKAALSHTGTLAGSDAVLSAAFRRSGVLQVDEISELFEMAEVLAKEPRPKGPRLAVLTNAGGPGVLATDSLIWAGGQLAELSPEAFQALGAFLPPHWSRQNPVDILGDADPKRYADALKILADDKANDGLLVILTPQAMTDPTETARALAAYAKRGDKPILASWMGGADVEEGRSILRSAGISVFDYPDEAARGFCHLWRYSDNLRVLYETPALPAGCPDNDETCSIKVREILSKARKANRTILTEYESKAVLSAYGFPVVETHVAENENEAVRLAEKIGYPVVCKLHSETVTHKTDVSGVKLDLKDGDAVRRAFNDIREAVEDKKGKNAFQGVTVQPMVRLDGYELIIGSSLDPQFGPVLLFGLGGGLVEVFKDTALSLPPLNTTLARRFMERTRVYEALKGVRGKAGANLELLDETLVRFSQLVAEEKWIKEIDVNPFLVSADRMIALDARIILHDPRTPEDQLPKLAIRPYPTEYVSHLKMKDGKSFTIRPIRPEDEPLMVQFHKALSQQSIRRRYFQELGLNQRIAHERLIKICFNDFDREIALVAELGEGARAHEIAGVVRLSRIHGTGEAEFSTLIADPFQSQGLGTEMAKAALEIGKKEGITRVYAEILTDNVSMQHIFKKLGFKLLFKPGEETWTAELDLASWKMK